jgi:hypothetical protein
MKHTNKWVRAHGRLLPPYLCETSTVQGHFLAVAWSRHKEFVSAMAFKEVYGCEILISEIERRPALYNCSLKEYGDKGDFWEKCARAKIEMLGIMRKDKNMVFQPQYAQCFTAATYLPQTCYNLQYQNTSTVSDIPNKRTVNSPTLSDALSNQSDFLDIC